MEALIIKPISKTEYIHHDKIATSWDLERLWQRGSTNYELQIPCSDAYGVFYNDEFIGFSSIDKRYAILLEDLNSLFSSETQTNSVKSVSISIIIKNEFRNKGIGNVLLGKLIQVVEQNYSINEIAAEIYVENEPSLALFTKHGFTFSYLSNGIIYMKKSLTPEIKNNVDSKALHKK